VGTAAAIARSVTALLLDEMLSGTIAEQLRARDIDVVAVVEDAALVATPDGDLLANATERECVLVTANIVDFTAIATDWRASGRTHPGLVYVTYRSFPQDRSFIGALVSSLAAAHDAGDLPGHGIEFFLRRA
jgi:hypothetical protein